VTTAGAIASWPTKWVLGSTQGYNAVRFPIDGKWMDGDTPYWAWLANGTILLQENDGHGPEGILYSGGSYTAGRNIFLSTINAAFTSIALLNPLGTGDGDTGYGGETVSNIPNCYSDGSHMKGSSMLAEGNVAYMIPYRQNGSGYNQKDGYIVRSDDAGVTWFNSTHTVGSANGDRACPGSGVMWPGVGKTAVPRFIKGGGQGGAITNPVHGIDAYQYLQFRDNGNANLYLGRIYKRLDYQVVANWESYSGPVGGDENDPANWSLSTTDLAAIAAAGSSQQDGEIQYLAQFGRFIMTGENVVAADDYRIVILDSPRLTGPYVVRYNEPTKPAFMRAWPTIWMPTFTDLATNPPSASAQLLHSGVVDQRNTGDPVNNRYSPWMADVTITAVSSAQATGKVTISGKATIQ
jgi:hypothetical protein